MAENKTAKRGTPRSAKSSTAKGKASKGFSAEERAAMKAGSRAEGRRASEKNRAQGERDVLAAIAAMKESDRASPKRLHAIVTASAPALWPKTWYGMPAYAKDGKLVCFFKSAGKFNSRYATVGSKKHEYR